MPAKKKNTSGLKTVKPSGTRDENFFELVYEVARQIPKGRVTSYGAIANCLGTKLSARMVGWVMNGAGKVKPKVPAHRVVNRLGIPPSAGMVNTSVFPSYWPVKAMVLPSGENLANISKPLWVVSLRAIPPASGTEYKSPA